MEIIRVNGKRDLLSFGLGAERIIDERLPLYEEVADATVDTAGRGSGWVAREIFTLLKREGVLVRM